MYYAFMFMFPFVLMISGAVMFYRARKNNPDLAANGRAL